LDKDEGEWGEEGVGKTERKDYDSRTKTTGGKLCRSCRTNSNFGSQKTSFYVFKGEGKRKGYKRRWEEIKTGMGAGRGVNRNSLSEIG